MATSPVAPFLWGAGGAAVTPEQVARQREMAALLMREGANYSPVGHWTQGLARMAQGIVGGLESRWADEREAEGRSAFQSEWGDVFSGAAPVADDAGGTASPVVAAAADLASPPSDMQAYRDAIASIESAGSGDYAAVGPTHPKLGRALGRYQIMEANIGPWSREALGREVSPDEFLANPQLQDAIFDHRFGQYVNQYGPEGAAQAWFAGPGGVGKTGRSDVLGTTVGDYTGKFNAAMGGEPRQQVAQALIPDMNSLIQLASNPWASPAQQQIVQSLIGQQLQQQAQAADPLRQLQIERAGLEIDALRNPPPPPPIEVGGVLLDPTTFEPIFDSRGDAGFTLSPGQQRFDAQGNPIAAVDAAPDQTTAVQNYEYLVSQGVDPATALERAFSGGVNVNVGGEQMTPGWKKIDETFAPEYLQWASGGAADTKAQLANINNALSLMEGGQAVTGNVMSALPREVQAFFNTDGIIARENIEEVVQRSLRETLGAQFTEREGERLIQRAFNPLLPTEENVRRAKLLLEKLQSMAESKDGMADYFRQHGTLMGYEGRAPSMNDLLAVERQFGEDPQTDLPEGVTEDDVQFTMQKHGLTREQVLERLNAS